MVAGWLSRVLAFWLVIVLVCAVVGTLTGSPTAWHFVTVGVVFSGLITLGIAAALVAEYRQHRRH